MRKKTFYFLLSLLVLSSCSIKDKYGIIPWKIPAKTGSDSAYDITKDSTRLKFIPNTGAWDQNVKAYEDIQYDQYLTRSYGWNGGDGNYSHAINDTTTLWTFQDSFIGIVDNTRNRDPSLNKFVRNAGVLQYNHSMESFVQLNQGTSFNSKTWVMYDNLESNDTKELYWPGDGHVVNGKFQMMLSHLVYDQNGGLSHPSTDVGVFSIPDMKLLEVIKNKYVGDVSYDACILDNDDGYSYIYGNTGSFLSSSLHVARAANHDITGPWQFLTANGWADTPDNFTILQDSQTLPNVIKRNGKYYLVSQGWGYGHQIFLWQSSSPVGPFTNRKIIYSVPEDSRVVTYNTTVHESLSVQGELVIAYNINPINFGDNFNAPGSADLYRPHVVRIFNWQ